MEARERKTRKYLGLVEEIEEGGFCATILPLQVGSRGMVEVKGFERLRPHLSDSHHKRWKSFFVDIARKAIIGSQKIWSERN